MFKVKSKNTRSSCGICSKLTIKTSERRHWRSGALFTVKFESLSSLLCVFIVNFEQVNGSWDSGTRRSEPNTEMHSGCSQTSNIRTFC